ncbi:D-alanyl-D-alanine carboxypeptidase/D-alanyl-D-alanine-endopeptidase [Loktanella sp. SALINAS62]|uniref:D-alanyl-D-alanine carboxypeptidase/D-alanyl-D-alanine endopeptidase n=1 Tax=Loktanella sp. SALINAS62 TaxID=2706124 RepID=UPI001B8C2985|nr:D-alanyl-D-alanine carboxypeptidase/D-alanyl-D-alanine-endopeptidase [Loktanella sp. SALINAS62]MBS1304040.1 D-alanyl-D-alanine carboxypeptidase/D-alanyl-D-alanine-endopeptidase [Loktanella sp. SALINAS62]
MTSSGHMTRRGLLGALLAGGATAALAAPTETLRPVLRPVTQRSADALLSARPVLRSTAVDLIREAGLAGQTGFIIADAATGEILEAVEPDVQRPPASVTKAVTALYARETMGADYQFITRVLATGPIVDGVLRGDLILAGGGDPGLATDDLAVLAAAVAAAGVTEVQGAFHVWGGALPGVKEIEPGQLDQLSYNPSLGGLNLNFNRVYFEWQRGSDGYDVTLDARSATLRPAVTVARMDVVDTSGPVYTYTEGPGVDNWTVARRALGNAGSRWLPVRFPALYAAEVFRTLAQDAGIALPAGKTIQELPDGTEIARHVSAALDPIIRDMLRYSTNLTAEALGMTATATRVGGAQELRTSASLMADWTTDRAGVSPTFVDHSGLSDANSISARDMMTLLTAPGVSDQLKPLLRSVVMVDDARRAIPDMPGSVSAKTGTLNFVSALAGYATTGNGRRLAFAIFSHDPDARAASRGSLDERPAGASGFNGKAKRLQQKLLQHWLILGDITG